MPKVLEDVGFRGAKQTCNSSCPRLRPNAQAKGGTPGKGASFKGVFFPDRTKFGGTHKGRTYTAEIRGAEWVGADGVRRTSPSDAAVAATGKNWNGWLFWHCKLPGSGSWQLINGLRATAEAKLAAL
jgi:hypothetical protein